MEVFIALGVLVLFIVLVDVVRHKVGSHRGNESLEHEVAKSQNHTHGHESHYQG